MTSSRRSFYLEINLMKGGKVFMSIQKSSIKRLTAFFKGLRDNANVSRALCVEQTTSPVALSHQPVYPNRDVTKAEDLERYYAKPGEAEWGC